MTSNRSALADDVGLAATFVASGLYDLPSALEGEFDIVYTSNGVDAGLRPDFLHEFDFVNWPVPWLVKSDDGRYRLPPGTPRQLPPFFSLKAMRPG